MVLVFPFMEGFCFDAGSLRGAAGPTNGRLVSVALFTLIVNPQHDRSPLQAHLVCETASPSRFILHEIRLALAACLQVRENWNRSEGEIHMRTKLLWVGLAVAIAATLVVASRSEEHTC